MIIPACILLMSAGAVGVLALPSTRRFATAYRAAAAALCLGAWALLVLSPRPSPMGMWGMDTIYGYPFVFGRDESDVRTSNWLGISAAWSPMHLVLDMAIWVLPMAGAMTLLLYQHHRRLGGRSLWQWRRLRRGLCPACGYDLRGTSGLCPECGAERAGRSAR